MTYSDDLIKKISNCNGIIFDCDGVLVDVTESYERTIIETAYHIFEDLGIKQEINSKIIQKFKSAGGFNNEIDLTYAIIISVIAAEKLSWNKSEMLDRVAENSDEKGIKTVEKYLMSLVDISSEIKKFDYPGNSIIQKIFEQIFYGPTLYEKIYKEKSKFSNPGLIENDNLIINKDLMDYFCTRFSRVGMLTGRGLLAARHSLGSLLDRFDLKNSMFLEDESRDLAKPNPESLIKLTKNMNCIYVGDSMEDLLMTKDLDNVTFCGISDNDEKSRLFIKNGADIVIDSINSLQSVIESRS